MHNRNRCPEIDLKYMERYVKLAVNKEYDPFLNENLPDFYCRGLQLFQHLAALAYRSLKETDIVDRCEKRGSVASDLALVHAFNIKHLKQKITGQRMVWGCI